jgi:hypothetical protein
LGTLARQQTTDNRQQTTDNRQQTTDNRQPIIYSLSIDAHHFP